MRQAWPRIWKHGVMICAGLLVGCSAMAQDNPDKRDAQAWLKLIQSAAQKLNYAGVFIYQQADQVRTSRITHVVDGKTEIEKLEILDGAPRELIRKNDDVTYYIPETRTLLVEKRVTQDYFPAIPGGPGADLGEHYLIRKEDTGRVAGYDAQVILLIPRDHLRYGYRLWAERSTGLLLRSQTLNEDGFPVEQIGFAQISINNIDRTRVQSSYGSTKGWQVESSNMKPARLAGWSVKGVPPGFRKVRELTRTVWEEPAAPGQPPTQREVSQIVYSDGLAAISVFIEPLARGKVEGYMQQGAMNIFGRRHGDYWLTVLGEVPMAAIKQVAGSIEFSKPR